jgi:hypothetical protein
MEKEPIRTVYSLDQKARDTLLITLCVEIRTIKYLLANVFESSLGDNHQEAEKKMAEFSTYALDDLTATLMKYGCANISGLFDNPSPQDHK